MNICVVGAGAIGGWIAAELALAGSDVSVVARGETLRLIDAEGLRLTLDGTTHCVAVATADDPLQLGLQDLVVIAPPGTVSDQPGPRQRRHDAP